MNGPARIEALPTKAIPLLERWLSDGYPFSGHVTHADQCNACQRRAADMQLRCQAFPGRIPVEILTGEHDHAERFAGDHGLQWIPGPPAWSGRTTLQEADSGPPDGETASPGTETH